jgi:hypothetical protein
MGSRDGLSPKHVSQRRIPSEEFPGSDPLHDLNNGSRSKFWMGGDKDSSNIAVQNLPAVFHRPYEVIIHVVSAPSCTYQMTPLNRSTMLYAPCGHNFLSTGCIPAGVSPILILEKDMGGEGVRIPAGVVVYHRPGTLPRPGSSSITTSRKHHPHNDIKVREHVNIQGRITLPGAAPVPPVSRGF